MMKENIDITLIGLSHKTAPVNLRERIAFSGEEAEGALDVISKISDVKEVLLFSTCNRVEIAFTTTDTEKAIHCVQKEISRIKSIPVEEFEKSLYIHTGDEAVRHIFRVACSLDSMMVGEPQILGQVKDAYRLAISKKTSGVILNRLLHRAFNISKRVRSETGIGDSAVSISYAAVELGKKIFGLLEGKKILLVGAGEMAELAVEHLIRNRVGEIYVANRTFENGVSLAKRFNGTAIKFEEIPDALANVDIIVSSTGAKGFVITRDDVKKVTRKRRNRPLFFIDIAVPRDIDPSINKMANMYVYDIDDLKSVIDENIGERNKEAVKGERMVDEAVIQFREWFDSLQVVPTIVDMRGKFSNIAEKELAKTFQQSKHLTEEDTLAIKRMTDAIINKILHDPISLLKNGGSHRDPSVYLDVVRILFKLDE